MTGQLDGERQRSGPIRSRATKLVVGLCVVTLVVVLPILMVVSNRSAAAVVAVAAAMALLTRMFELGSVEALRRVARLRVDAGVRFAALFLGWGLISILWSRHPWSSLVDWTAVLAPVVAFGLLHVGLRGRAPPWTPLALTVGMIVAMVGIWIEIKFGFPISRALGNRQSPVAFNRPTLTILVLFWPLVSLLRARGNDLVALTMFMLVTMTCSLTHSGTALAAVLFSTFAYGAVQVAPRLTVRFGIVAMLALVLLAPWLARTIEQTMPFRAELADVAVRSARSGDPADRWRSPRFLRQPIFGYGFGSSRWVADAPAADDTDPRHGPRSAPRSRNNFYQIWAETGGIGAVLFAAFLAVCLRGAWHNPSKVEPADFAFLAATVLIACISHGAWQAWWIAVLAAAASVMRLGEGTASLVAPYGEGPNGFATILSWPRRTIAVRALAFLHDALLTGAAFVLALLLRLGVGRMLSDYPKYWWPATFIMMIAAVTGPMFGLNSGVWRYASLPDLRGIVSAATTTTIFFLIAENFVPGLETVPRSVPLGAWFIIVILLSGPRVAYRTWKSSRAWNAPRRQLGRELVLVVGAGSETDLFVRETMERSDLAYEVVGVIDERGRRTGQSIRGVPILGTIEDIPRLATQLTWNERRPAKIIVTRSRAELAGEVIERLLTIAQENDLAVVRLPDIGELRSASNIRLQPISIEDLLHRDPVELDLAGIHALVNGAHLLVTGGGGSIGSELCRQVATLHPRALTIIDYSEPLLYEIDRQLRTAFPKLEIRSLIADVRDRAQMMRLVADIAPDIVFHAAALKHVPIVEAQPCEGLRTNAFGTRNVADAAIAAGTRTMVMISTDKAINPTSVMGASKRLAELYCQALDVAETTRFITVRFGNVLGSTGSVVPLFQKQIEAGGPITITHPDVTRYFLTIPEAVQLVLQATNHGMRDPSGRGAIFVLDMGPAVRITNLAEKMVRLAGLRVGADIKIVYIGLRPGEKLFEEVFGVDEPPVATPADGVLMAYPRVLPRQDVDRIYSRFAMLLEGLHDREVVEGLMQNIAEYVPDDRLLRRLGIATRRMDTAVEQESGSSTPPNLPAAPARLVSRQVLSRPTSRV